MRAVVLIVAYLASGCEPDLVVGNWPCDEAPLMEGVGGAGAVAATDTPIGVPWGTGFENGFCGYRAARGFCYSDPEASYALTDVVARSGSHAAAFTVDSDDDARQARCVREGILPDAAYYGAWFYVPEVTVNQGNWNLMHFQGSDGTRLPGTWDVSLDDGDDGQLFVYVFDFFRMSIDIPETDSTVSVGTWFHLQFFLQRATDETGRVALYLDGRLIYERTDTITDYATWGQWYVGNLANRLTPSEVTLYVDDVTISDTL
jgi:hypothetical protein